MSLEDSWPPAHSKGCSVFSDGTVGFDTISEIKPSSKKYGTSTPMYQRLQEHRAKRGSYGEENRQTNKI